MNKIINLLVVMLICFSVSARNLTTTNIGGRQCYIYDVAKGENIYDVSRKLGIPTSEITRYNPTASDGLRSGMRLYIPVELVDRQPAHSDKSATPRVPATRVDANTDSKTESSEVSNVDDEATNAPEQDETYTVKRKDTLYGISTKFHTTMDDLIALNPDAEYGVKAGDVLVIRKGSASRPQSAEPSQPDSQADRPDDRFDRPDYSLIPSEQRISDKYIMPVSDNDDQATLIDSEPVEVNLAVMLPFMLQQENPDKNAQLYLEFYKGLLLAADSLKTQQGNHINIYAYDTAASLDTVVAIMGRPEMSSMDLIIGPDNESQLRAIIEHMSGNTHLFNAFNVRTTFYESDPRVIQSNIPHAPMLSKAVEAFRDMYHSYTPVFVSRIDGAADKDAFISLLKQHLDTDSVAYHDITFRNLLSLRDLEELPVDQNYVFVPISGSRAEFAKLSEAIRRYGESRPNMSTRLFGYPDWITFRGEYFNRLGELEATIYTRFYADMQSDRAQQLSRLYEATYGNEMLDAAPVQGLLGFDTGMYLIDLLKEYGNDFANNMQPYSGVQSVMNFVHAPNQGLVNNALLIVTFLPSGSTIKTVIE